MRGREGTLLPPILNQSSHDAERENCEAQQQSSATGIRYTDTHGSENSGEGKHGQEVRCLHSTDGAKCTHSSFSNLKQYYAVGCVAAASPSAVEGFNGLQSFPTLAFQRHRRLSSAGLDP